MVTWSAWVMFHILVIVLMILDLFVFSGKNKTISFRQSMALSAFWIFLALAFNTYIYFWLGKQPALEFLTGYVIEKSLSVDNLFVFLLIFSYFKVPAESQRLVLLWGIIGAQVMRAVFILAGVAVLAKYHWVIYIFGVILIISGIKLFTEKDKEVHPEDNPVLKFFKRFFKVTPNYHGKKFWIKESGQWVATPLMVVLIAIETTDLIFAVDSIPAILAITKDPFIAYTSNIFAILGLRALYFALHHLMGRFHLLHYGLGIILIYVGCKMLLESVIHIPIIVSLGIICSVLTISIVASWYVPADKK